MSKETPSAIRPDWPFLLGASLIVVLVLGAGVFAFERYGGEFVDGLDEQIGELIAKQAKLAAEAGRADEALQLFEQALAASFIKPEQRIYAIQEYAQLLIEAGRHADALAWIERGAAADANDIKLAFLRFDALRDSSQLEPALAAAAAWYRLGDQNNDAETMRAAKFGEATLLRDAGRTEAALDAFLAAHTLRPGGDTAIRAARMSMQLGRIDQARSLLEFAVEAPGGDAAAARALLEQLKAE